MRTIASPFKKYLGIALTSVMLSSCGGSSSSGESSESKTLASAGQCATGDRPETGVQGQVPLEDRESGRSQLGYNCNLNLIGQYQGEGASWVNPSYESCMYMATAFGGIATKNSQGVQVVDASNPLQPTLSTTLTSPAMQLGTWESLKVNVERGLLAGVAVGPAVGAAFFDIYSIGDDCSQPVLLNGLQNTNVTLPANFLGHEGGWSPDGNTYWATGLVGGAITAIDVSDPASPRNIFTSSTIYLNHGFSVSEDGNRLYLTTAFPAGIIILDVSEVQSRKPIPIIREISRLQWNIVGVGQHTIPIFIQDKPYLIAVDEFASESIKFIDISDEQNPIIQTEFRLAINMSENQPKRAADTAGNGLFGYESHYCSVDYAQNPTALACGYFQSGVRVFDIRDIDQVTEIAYFNPPAQTGRQDQLQGSEHAANLSAASSFLAASDVGNLTLTLPSLFGPIFSIKADLSADWCSSPPRFVGPNQLWVVCQDNGALILEFADGVYPFE